MQKFIQHPLRQSLALILAASFTASWLSFSVQGSGTSGPSEHTPEHSISPPDARSPQNWNTAHETLADSLSSIPSKTPPPLPESSDPQEVLDALTPQHLLQTNGTIVFHIPHIPDMRLWIGGSDLTPVVSDQGVLSQANLQDRPVTLLIRAEHTQDPKGFAERNLTLTIPAHRTGYPKSWFPLVADPNPQPEVLPSLQEWYGHTGTFVVTSDTRIVYDDRANVGLEYIASHLQKDLEEICGQTIPISVGSSFRPSDIYLSSQPEDIYQVGAEGYVMVTDHTGLQIYAPSYTGVLYGTITLEQILWQAEDRASVPRGVIRDYPAYEVRGVMLDVARHPFRLQQLEDIARMMLWYKMNEYHLHINDNDNANTSNKATDQSHVGFHRLESQSFPSLRSQVTHQGYPQELVNTDYYPEYGEDPHYTKEEWKQLSAMCERFGIYLLTELDMPGHALLYNQYAEENPDQIPWLEGGIRYSHGSTIHNKTGGLELLELRGPNAQRALQFAVTLWDEYTADQTIAGDVVHVGGDEYWDHSMESEFIHFVDTMRQTIQKNLPNAKMRMWGAGKGMFSQASTQLHDVDLPSHYQLDIWSPAYDSAPERLAQGYQVVNCSDQFLYSCPGRNKRDVLNPQYLFSHWDPTIFGAPEYNVKLGDPGLLGAKAVMWGEQTQEGLTERDIHMRLKRNLAIVSEKTWGGTHPDDHYQAYELRAARLGEGPGTSIAMDIPSKTSLVLHYDFQNRSQDETTILDLSGNGYHGQCKVPPVVNDQGFLRFDGNQSLTTPLKTLSYPYTLSFRLRLTPEDLSLNHLDSLLFSGYDGRIQITGKSGGLMAMEQHFLRDLGYQVPADQTLQITLVGTFQGSRLYVNGQLVTFLSQTKDQDFIIADEPVTTMFSSIPLPLETIGQGLYGQLADLKVYHRAFSPLQVAQDAAGEEITLVNVAQNALATERSFRPGDLYDHADPRLHVASKAVDGDAFLPQSHPAQPMDPTTSEMNSFWKGHHEDSALILDFGQPRSIQQIEIQWREGGRGTSWNLLGSMDGVEWFVIQTVENNQDFHWILSLEEPVQTQWIQMQGIAGDPNQGVYMIQELLAYEKTDQSLLEQSIQQMEAKLAQMGWEKGAEEPDTAVMDSLCLARATLMNPIATQTEIDTAQYKLDHLLQSISSQPSL